MFNHYLQFQLHASATAEPNNLISVINLTDLAIKRIIKMAKQITPFINMCQEDQIALLKGGCTELMILRSIISYNPEKNSWSVSVMIGYIALDKLIPYCIGQIYTKLKCARLSKSESLLIAVIKALSRASDNTF